MILRLRGLVYGEIKKVEERKQDVRRNWQNWLEIFLYFVFIVRLSNVQYMKSVQNNYPYWKVDYLGQYAVKNAKQFDTYFSFTRITMDLLAVLSKIVIYVKSVDTVSSRINYQLLVVNTDVFWNAYSETSSNTVGYGGYKINRWLTRLKAWYKLKHLNRKKFMSHTLTLFPMLSFRIRSQLALLVIFMDYYAMGIQTIQFLVLLEFDIKFVPAITKLCYPGWYKTAMCVDFLIINNNTLLISQMGVLMALVATTTTVVYTRHINQVNNQLLQHFKQHKKLKCSKNRTYSLLQMSQFAATLRKFLLEHERVSRYLAMNNQQLWAYPLFIFVVFNIPVNILLLNRLLLDHLEPMQRVMIVMILILQLVTTGSLLVPFAVSCSALHTSHKIMPYLQPSIPNSMIGLKIKYLSLYERISSGWKHGVTLGPVVTITYTSLLRLLSIYVGYLLYALSIKLQTKK